MRLVEISKFLGMETSLIEKLRDGGNLLISQASSLRDNNIQQYTYYTRSVHWSSTNVCGAPMMFQTAFS